MSQQGAQTTHLLKLDSSKAGAVLALATVTPILIGLATIAYHWPMVPLNLSLAAAAIVWIEARNERRTALLIHHMEERDEATRLDTLKAEVTRIADLRTFRSGK